jgi:hypothetical protein
MNQDDQIKKDVQSRSHCTDVFEEYVTTLKRQHGIIRNATSDPPLFDPGISVSHYQIISSNDNEHFFVDHGTTSEKRSIDY